MNIQTLRIIGLLEGISFLLLLFIAMPMKYMLDNPVLVKYVGMGHGVLFMLFLIVLFMVCEKTEMVDYHVYIGFNRIHFTVWHFCFRSQNKGF